MPNTIVWSDVFSSLFARASHAFKLVADAIVWDD